MTDPDPSSRNAQGRRAGFLGLFGMFRRAPDHPANHTPAPQAGESEDLLSQARAFKSLRVEDVMKPRADIVAVERSATFAELVARFAESEHSRMPVYRETLDEPVGVVHLKDVFKLLARKSGPPKPDDSVLGGRHRLVRKVLSVPPSMPAATLLAQMQVGQTHLALVIDEFGGVDGLVTLEDLLETLVGEIADEHDDAEEDGPAPIIAEDGWLIVDGRTPLSDLEQTLGQGVDLAPEDVDEEIETVAGLVNSLAGRVPQRRERIDHPSGYSIEVLSADPRRVKRVRVSRVEPPAA